MKKQAIISFGFFVFISGLCLLSNFIQWDETALEQTIYVLPLAGGMLLQVPFLSLLGLFANALKLDMNYELIWIITPLVAGAFYTALFYSVQSFCYRSKSKVLSMRT